MIFVLCFCLSFVLSWMVETQLHHYTNWANKSKINQICSDYFWVWYSWIFENLSLKWLWEDAGGGCNEAVFNLLQKVLANRPRDSRSANLSSGEIGIATLQLPPAFSHSHFGERFSIILDEDQQKMMCTTTRIVCVCVCLLLCFVDPIGIVTSK